MFTVREALLPIGFGHIVAVNRILLILNPQSANARRMVQQARQEGKYVDATYGRRTKSLLLLDTGHLVACALNSDTLLRRAQRLARAAWTEGGDEVER